MDPVWMAVLLLTRDMMRGGENLYYYGKQTLNMVDISRMNDLLKAYPAMREKVKAMGRYSFPEGMDQKNQTMHFLKHIGVSQK